jgi:hypothetical protein
MIDYVTAKDRKINFNFSKPNLIQTLKKRIRSWLLQIK